MITCHLSPQYFGEGFMAWEELHILKKIHPKADIYFLRTAMIFGVILVLKILTQLTTVIELLK